MMLTLFLVVLVLTFDSIAANWAAVAATATSECCSTCIGKTANAAYTYDPVIFAQCSNVTGGVCCFDCGNLGDPTYGDTVSYASDGVTAVVKAGTYISFTWTGVVNVTYVSLKTGQKKTVTPRVTDTNAMTKASTFLICAKSAGTIYFRGWGKETCREASPEHLVTVEAGESSTSTCDATDVSESKEASSSSTIGSGSTSVHNGTVETCNAQRASYQVVDGKQTCVCVSDWTGPPECNQWPVWKWLVTVGGGVAALFSILISLNALLPTLRRKKQDEEDEKDLAEITPKDNVATLEMTATSSYYGNAMTVPTTYDPQADRTSGVPKKPVENEFTL